MNNILGITADVEFVPFSKSRFAGQEPCLNWKVTLKKGGRAFLTTDYMAGVGHCPSYKQGRLSVVDAECIQAECETGRPHFFADAMGCRLPRPNSPPILPKLADVLDSLTTEYDAINYGSFEEWAENFGYDTDSRKAESVYRECLEIGLKMRNGLGDNGMAELQTALEQMGY